MNNPWIIGSIHPIYGKCIMMGTNAGESIRGFMDKNGVISVIPLEVLNNEIPHQFLE